MSAFETWSASDASSSDAMTLLFCNHHARTGEKKSGAYNRAVPEMHQVQLYICFYAFLFLHVLEVCSSIFKKV